MILNKRLLVVVPALNEESQIPQVIRSMPPEVDAIVVVDDGSTDRTAAVVEMMRPEVSASLAVVSHTRTSGVGAAILTGYRFGVEKDYELVAVMAGDGQMPANDLLRVAFPVASEQVDYAKANRLARLSWWATIPRRRLAGNLVLSAITQVASGLWGTWDSQSGFTVISQRAASRLVRVGIYPQYGCPNDILIKLAALGFRVRDVPSAPVYGVGEVSKLKIRRVLLTIPFLMARGFFWRMREQYWAREDRAVPVLGMAGGGLLVLGLLSNRREVRKRGAQGMAVALILDGILTRRGTNCSLSRRQ